MSKNTIVLKNFSDHFDYFEAAEAITPGALVEINSNNKVQNHSNAGQNAEIVFAIEDAEQGNGITDDYSTGDQVKVWFPQKADEVYAILEDGESVNPSSFLESAGNGNLQEHTADTESIGADSSGNVNSFYTLQIVGKPTETLDLSGSSGEESSALQGDQRLEIRVV